MYDLTLIIPAKNERESLPKVIAELNNKYKIKVVLKENDYETIEAIKNLKTGEILLVAGKGHETIQDFGKHKIFFSTNCEFLQVVLELNSLLQSK